MILGTVFIAGGAVLIAVFGIVPEPTHSLDDLLRLFGRAAFVVYFSLLGLVVIIWLVVVSAPALSSASTIRLTGTSLHRLMQQNSHCHGTSTYI